MKRVLWVTAAGGLLASLLLVALPGLAANTAPGIGINAAIRNVVQLKIVTEQSYRRAILREPIHIGDHVTSGPDSALQVLLKDQTVFTVGANARMTIDKFVYDPERGNGALAASLAQGAFRFMSGRAGHTPGGQVVIKTPVASIGVRGTSFAVAVGPEAVALMQDVRGPDGKPVCEGRGCDPRTAMLTLLLGPGPKNTGKDHLGVIEVTAGGVSVSLTRASIAFVPGPGMAPILLPVIVAVEHGFDALLSTQPNRDDVRNSIQGTARAMLVALDRPNPALELAHVALDRNATPAELQAALAIVGDQVPRHSRSFDHLMTMSVAITDTSGTSGIGAIEQELATGRGTLIIRSLSDAHYTDLRDALAYFALQGTGSTLASSRVAFDEGGHLRLDSVSEPEVAELTREIVTPPTVIP